MRAIIILGVALVFSGCAATHVEINETTGLVSEQLAKTSPDAAALASSARYCRARLCSQTPVVMVVIGRKAEPDAVIKASLAKGDKFQGFMFAGSTVYDGRLQPKGTKYLAYRDPEGKLVCQGYYSWSGFGRTSDVNLRCFDDSAKVSGTIRNAGRQPKGRYRGKGIGTGVLSFEGGVIAVVYGVDPEDLKEKNFVQLWQLHGGNAGELPFKKMPKRVNKVPTLKKEKLI